MLTSCSRRPRNGLDNEFSGGSFQLPPFRLRDGAACSPSPLPSGEVELRSNWGEGLRPLGGAEPLTSSGGRGNNFALVVKLILGRSYQLSSRLYRRRYWLHASSHRQRGLPAL